MSTKREEIWATHGTSKLSWIKSTIMTRSPPFLPHRCMEPEHLKHATPKKKEPSARQTMLHRSTHLTDDILNSMATSAALRTCKSTTSQKYPHLFIIVATILSCNTSPIHTTLSKRRKQCLRVDLCIPLLHTPGDSQSKVEALFLGRATILIIIITRIGHMFLSTSVRGPQDL